MHMVGHDYKRVKFGGISKAIVDEAGGHQVSNLGLRERVDEVEACGGDEDDVAFFAPVLIVFVV